MKRFVEDYDPEIHESFPCISPQAEVVLDERVGGDSERQIAARDSSVSLRYNRHVQGQRRNTVNLASFQLIFMTCVYYLTYELGLGIEHEGQPTIAIIPCLFANWLIVKPLMIFTYYDDLLLTY